MAKKEQVNFDDLNLDDIDFGGDFDFNTDGEIKFDADDSRSPIESFITSAKDGLKDRIMDRGLIRRLLSFALPKGYSQAFNAYDSLSNGVADIYKDNAAEMQPYMQKTNRFLKQQNPMFKRLLPKGAREALESSENENQSWGSSQDDKLNSDIGGIDKLLGMEARNKLDDNISEARREMQDRKEFKTTTGISIETGKAIGRLVQYQDTVLINYHRKSLELKYRHLDVSMRQFHSSEVFNNDALDLMKAIGKNTALPDFVKMRNTEIIKEQLRHRLANNVIGSAANFAKKHLGNIKDNLSASLGGALSGVNLATSMGGGSKAAMAGDALGGLVSGGLADLLEYAVKEGLTKLGLGKEAGYVKSGGRWLQNTLSGASQRVNDFARSETTSTGLRGQFEDFVKRQLDSYTITDKINGGGVYSLDEAAKFDNLFHKTVTEIIPGQLSSMEKWLRTIATGQEQEEHAYSHYTGGFVERSTLNQQHIDIGLKAGAGDAVRKQLDYLLKDMDAEGLSPKARRALRARLMTDMSGNNDFDPKRYVKPQTWSTTDPDVAEELVEFFADKYGINIDGEYDDADEDAKDRRTKARAEYLDLAPRITDYTGRMAGLAEVIGRRSFRELGLSKYDGRSGDNIDVMAVYDKIANEGGDEFVVGDKKEEEKADPFTFSRQGFKDGINARADLARKKMEEKEAEQKRLAEEAAKAAEAVKVDVDGGKTSPSAGGPTPGPAPVIQGQFGLDPMSIDKLTSALSEVLTQQGGAGQYEMTLPETLETVDSGTHDRLDSLTELLGTSYQQQFDMLEAILGAIKDNDPCACEGKSPAAPYEEGDDEEVEGSGAKDGLSRFGRLKGGLWKGIKRAPGRLINGLGRYLGWSYGKIGQGISGAYGLGKWAAKAPFQGIKGLGVTDVHIQGDPDPVMTAKDIRRGYFFDVKTKKVIEKIKDITGPVRNRDGEMVITQEEFDQGLMSGEGESLAGWGLRKTLGAGLGLAGLTGRYFKGTYGLIGKAMKGAFNLAYDQFVQFDAYFPGDEEPRIRSSLLKKGFYRDADGAPIKSLKDIKGPIFDIEDNEVISQEELDKYKSLYTRNGSLLFTVGRGLVSGTAWAGGLAKRAAVGYAKMAGKFYKGLWRGAKAMGRGLKGIATGIAGKMGFKAGSPEAVATGGMHQDEELHTAMFELGIEQLNTQRGIFQLLRDKFESEKKDKWDLDGDGVRENSWADILRRRKEKKEKKEEAKSSGGNNADVVKAIDKLGKNLDGAIDELGDRVEEANEDGWMDQAADIGNIADGLNGGEGRGRRGRRGGRGGRGGRRGGRLGRLGGKVRGLGGRIAGSRAAGWAMRGGIMAAEGAATLGSAVLGSAAMGSVVSAGTAGLAAAGAGLAAGAATVGGWIAAGATAIGAVLSAPVVLAIAAVAAIGYVGYSWYKSSQAKNNPIFYLRMTQYGVDPTNETRVKQMLALEELLLPAVTFSGDKANIDAARVSIPELMKILEIEEGQDKRLKWALKWLAQRFRPVFLAHVGGMKKTVKSTKLADADTLIDGSVIKEFLEIVDLKNFEKIYNAILESPFDSTWGFGGSLDCGASDVEDAFELVRDRIKESDKPKAVKSQESPVDPKDADKLAADPEAAAALAAAAKATKRKAEEGDEPLDIGGMVRSGIDPTTALPPTGAGPVAAAVTAVAMTALPLPPGGPVAIQKDGATVSTAAPEAPEGLMQKIATAPLMAGVPGVGMGQLLGSGGALLKQFYQVTASKVKAFSASLDIPQAVRFLEYGITDLDTEKCKQLQQAEDIYWDFLKFNGYDNALIDGDLTALEDTIISIFAPTGGNPQNILMWLRYRFMPTFLQYAISVRRRLPGDVRQAPRNLTSNVMRDVLLETIQAVDSDSGQLVWLNSPSPWADYVLGKDAGITTPYIDALPKSLKTIVVEGMKDMASGIGSFGKDDPPVAKSNLYQGSPNQENEEGGIFSQAASSVKKFFGFGNDPGGTSGGSSSGMSANGGGGGSTPLPGIGGPAVGSMGAQVTHPGGGTGGDINSLPTSTGDGWEAMKGIIMGAAKMAGFDPFISANVAAVESKFKPRAGAGTSSAKGLYQFVNGTWGDMLRKYGKKYGIASNTHQFDPRANALMGMEYLKENYAYLKEKAKVPVTDTALYAAHFLGAYGARKFLTAPGSANSQDIVGAAAVRANASVFREPTGRKGVYGRVRTVAEALAEIDKRMQEARGQHDLKPGQQPIVAEGSENQAAENRPQTGEGEPGGADPEIGMDTQAAQSGEPSADAPGDMSGGGSSPVASGGGGGGSEAPVSNASNGAPSAGGGQTYAQPPSPDAAAATASGNAVLTREPDDDQGTFGTLRLPDGTEYVTLELPWRGNTTGASCIPPGTYQVAIRNSPKFGRIYEVQNVPGRTAILIHSGNVAGDESKGYNSHVEGCILLGLNKGKVGGQKAVQQSRAAIAQFNEKMGGRPFTMSVIGAGANANAKSVGDAPEEEGQTAVTGAQDVAESANGAASGSSAAVNTQQGPTAGPNEPTGNEPPAPTISQSTTNQNQNTTAASTAEMAASVGPLLEKQLAVQQSMDGSLKEIRDFLKTMSQQQPAAQQAPSAEVQKQPGSKDGQRQWAPEDEPVATQPRGTSTSTGSGRNPINVRRNNAVT